MGRSTPIQSSFNAGELSPRLHGRVDFGKYVSGVKRMERFIPLKQGPAKRCPGTRFVAEVDDSTKRSWLLRFQFNVDEAYILEFGDNMVRFFTDHGQVVVSGVAAWVTATAYVQGDIRSNGGVNYWCKAAHTSGAGTEPGVGASWTTVWHPMTSTIFEIYSPYSVSDLLDDDGSLKLSFAQSGDVIYFAHPSYAPYKLSRLGATNWTFAKADFTGGPFQEDNDSATTVYASAITGTGITLTASASIFVSTDVGTLFYLKQKKTDGIEQWEPAKAVSLNDLRRSDGKNYKALNAATTGTIRPVHTEGAIFDGDGAVQWEFQDPGFGIVKITGYTSGTVVTGDVQSQIPDQATLVANASERWALAAWSDHEGWPEHVAFFRERLVFSRANTIWMSVAGDFENFADTDFGIVTTDSSITIDLSTGDEIEWLEPLKKALVAGTAAKCFPVTETTTSDPLGPENIRADDDSARGVSGTQPVRVGETVLSVHRAGKRVRELTYSFDIDGFKSVDMSALADHMAGRGRIISMAYQEEPHTVLWCVTSLGKLLGFTYDSEQDVLAWHRHPIGGSGYVECVQTIPAPDGGDDELWLIVKRTIDGSTKRYIEYLEADFDDDADPQDAFFVDSGLTYDGAVAQTLSPGTGADVDGTADVVFTAGAAAFSAGDVGRVIHYRYTTEDEDTGETVYHTAKATITAYNSTTEVEATIDNPFPSTAVIASGDWRLTATTISGLGHLEGEEVDVLVDGATHPRRTVDSGEIELQEAGSKVQVGLPILAKIRLLPFEAGQDEGTAQGKTQRIDSMVLRVRASLGGKIGPDEDHLEEIQYRSTEDEMDEPPPLASEDIFVEFDGDYDRGADALLVCDQPLPFTWVAAMPSLGTYK